MTNALINSDNVIMEELVIIAIVTLIKLIYRQNIMERKTKKINQGKKDQKKRGGGGGKAKTTKQTEHD